MKKLYCFLFLVIAGGAVQAKKVKFAVDLTNHTISPNGVHVVGDFQQAAGLGPNWDPGKAALTKEGNTSIYSIVVNIPAFKKYEYRFVNGDQTYEVEFIPEESRVKLEVDNRWIYLDSLANDTTFTGAIRFGENAPAGKLLVRYKLNTNRLGVIPAGGFHVSTSYQSFDPSKTRLYSFGDGIYEVINYVSAGTFSYKFHNGNTLASGETVPSSCATSGYRSMTMSKDSVLPVVCFAECQQCQDVGIEENGLAPVILEIYPNPSQGIVNIVTGADAETVTLTDMTGREVLRQSVSSRVNTLDVSALNRGVYLVRVSGIYGQEKTVRLIVE